ncbi:MAG: carboxylating nicotinate-nucleotide diphosphorylase [Candidatus Omnitrophica bacterium]|nr:carboxylating nicotinate-nucleotide diphosphorylase [Candidatus Omnitrophota bacterium]
MNYINSLQLISLVRAALKEDLGKRDLTSELIIPAEKSARAVLLAKQDAVLCGLEVARLAFKLKDNRIQFKPLAKDGQRVKKGQVLARIQGKARSILGAERVALNFLGLLSGVATQANSYVEAARPYKVKILDTRKTIPGLRDLEKYAVRTGGGFNHRMRLGDMVLVKDNHIQVTSYKSQVTSLEDIIRQVRKRISKKIKLEIEVRNLREFKEALKAGPDIIMLDNMSIADIKKAIRLRRYTLYAKRYPLLEASGGITLKNIRRIASAGIERISVGALTHSVNSIDISLEIL